MKTNRHRLSAAFLACGFALSLTACGGGREYAVPKEACGVPLNEKVLEPFLVDGEKFRIVGDSLIETGTKTWGSCSLSVDDWLVVGLAVYRVDKIYDPMAKLDAFRFDNRAAMEDLPFPGKGAVGDFNSMVSTSCSALTADSLVVHVNVSIKSEGDVAERRRNIEEFTLDLVPKVKKKMGCTA
ncbi:hypothetical protein [Streptomyces laurentii]|uniref:hypothetical protein n=1 Tax=Streptomyces laurentii TaxID=39478 RepID=UPI00368FD037